MMKSWLNSVFDKKDRTLTRERLKPSVPLRLEELESRLVPSATLTGMGTNVTTTETQAFNGQVATFTDSDTTVAGTNLSAMINWGDGDGPTMGTVSGSDGTFTVTGGHTYADEGSFTVQVTLVDNVNNTSAMVNPTAAVAEGDVLSTGAQPLVIFFQSPMPVGYTVTNQYLQTFFDTNTVNTAGDFSAVVDWGDGTTSTGTVSGGNGQFSVRGSHTYNEEGTFHTKVTLTDDAPGAATASVTLVQPVMIQGFPITNGTGVPVNGFEDSGLNNIAVATFANNNGQQPASGFNAVIAWGDGTSSAGVVTLSGGVYTVSGSHLYADEGAYAVSVQVAEGGASSTISSSANIQEELLPDGTRGTADQRFISEVYRDLLHRPVDAGGLANVSALLSQGVSRDQVVLDIEQDSGHEYYNVEVQAAFQQYLHRAAEPTALTAFSNFLAAGNTVEQMDVIIVTSPEFLNVQGGGTNQGFLNAIYQDALGRAIDSSGQQSFGDGTPGTTAAAILSSNEYHTNLVKQAYANLLDRGVDPGDQVWINDLNTGISDEAVVAAIISAGGGEYYNKTAS